jgi:sigma-B regulation protein RsbU (phosphoserine phosphatase)
MAPQHMGTVALGIRHVLCAPLRLVRYVESADQASDDKVIGVLYLDSREPAALRSRAAHTALETLSREAAVAIENARLYREALERAKLDQELKIAAAIQRALLPKSDRAGTFFSAAGSSVPCRGVGGDFFDHVDMADGRFAFIVGDVAGKGAPAALLAAAALGMFGAEASYHSRCAPLVTRLTHGLCRRGIEGRFITAFYGILGSDGSLVYANAGHNAPVLVTQTDVRRLETGGLVLGFFEHASFEEEALTLAPGGVIVAFSDGVSEALNDAGEEYTDDRLLAAVHTNHGRPPQELLEALLADVRGFCGRATPNDDVTMVVVRYEG